MAVQIYLQMDRLDLARKEVAQAKSWAEDALLLQMMEAWVDLRVVKYRMVDNGDLSSDSLRIGRRKISGGILYFRRVRTNQLGAFY